MPPKPIAKQNLGLAGEYAVASELCKRGYYAQVTLGRQKRTDLLVYDLDSNKTFRCEVKSKQGNTWPSVKGISGSNDLLVLVDFKNKMLSERAEFYILNASDWRRYINKYIRPDNDAQIKDYCPYYKGHHQKRVRYVGAVVKPSQVSQHREAWKKL